MITQKEKNSYQKMDQKILNDSFIAACHDYNPDLIRYFLSDPELHCWADIHTENNLALFTACMKRDRELVLFLISSEQITEHADFVEVVKFFYYDDHQDIVNFLIDDCHIPLSEKLNDFVKNIPVLKTHFSKRQLEHELNKHSSIGHIAQLKI